MNGLEDKLEKHHSIGAWLATAGIVAPLIGITVLAYGLLHDTLALNVQSRFNQAYQQALLSYADTNHDSFVSTVEKDEFDRRLLEGKGVKLIAGDSPRYKDGKTVPIETVIEWIKGYKPQ